MSDIFFNYATLLLYIFHIKTMKKVEYPDLEHFNKKV